MADIIAHAQCSNQCLIFLGLATQPVNILKYSSPLRGGWRVATAELLLPKRIFSVSLKWGFQQEQLCSCKAYHTNGKQKIRRWAKRGLAKLYKLIPSPGQVFTCSMYKTKGHRETNHDHSLFINQKTIYTQNMNSLVYTKLQFVKLQ